MPTTRPRHFVTESDDLAAALDAEVVRWPELSRAQVLVQLALEAHVAAEAARDERRAHRLDSIRRHSGELSGVYGADYLTREREGWPE